MAVAIRYIRFSRDYAKFDEWKQNTEAIERHKVILKCLTKEWGICKQEDAEDDSDILKIYEEYIYDWHLLIISLSDIPFGVVRQCNENLHESWNALIETYEVSDEKRKLLLL